MLKSMPHSFVTHGVESRIHTSVGQVLWIESVFWKVNQWRRHNHAVVWKRSSWGSGRYTQANPCQPVLRMSLKWGEIGTRDLPTHYSTVQGNNKNHKPLKFDLDLLQLQKCHLKILTFSEYTEVKWTYNLRQMIFGYSCARLAIVTNWRFCQMPLTLPLKSMLTQRKLVTVVRWIFNI